MRKSHFQNSARNHGGGYDEVENSESGSLIVTARVSNGSSRYAMPSMPKLVYAALLYKDGESSTNENFVQGTSTENAGETKLNFSFQKPDDTSGTFTLEIFAFEKISDEDASEASEKTPQFSKETALLSGKKDGLSINGDTIEIDGTIALAISSTEPGTVSLKIKVPDRCSLEIKELKSDGTAESDAHFIVTGDSPNFTVTQKDESGIVAGAYQLKFTVKKKVGESEEIVHIFSEYINVINGFCTDTWSGSEKGEAKEISQSMISSTVYVRGTGGWYDKPEHYKDTAMASDSNSGSFLSPLASIQKAIDKIIAINDGASAYTIYVDGTLKCADDTYTGEKGMADFYKLSQNLTLTIKALSETEKATLGANKLSRVIKAKPESGALNLTLENLTLTGGNTSENGGGIYFGSAGGTLTISDGTTIKGNAASGNGGNVYVASGTFKMEGGTISGGNATQGGGVFINGGKFTMNDGTIGNNKASSSGGGVYVNSNQKFEMSGGTISGNEATSNGGGVYSASSSTFTMSGGAISGNKASKGKGAFISLTSMKMSDSARFAGSDDVYLHASGSNISKIIVAGPLTATSPVATITLSAYTANRRVLSKSTDVTITPDICKQFELTPDPNGGEWKIVPDSSGANGVLNTNTLYVRGTGAGWYADNEPGATASDNNSGAPLKPLATIQNAIDKIMDMNDGIGEYTIYVDGTLTQSAAIDYGMANFYVYDYGKDLTLTIKSRSETKKATLNANKKSRVIYAQFSGGKLKLSLENLVIMNGNNSGNAGGGGIYVLSSRSTIILTNCEIKSCEASYGGGGIMNEWGTVKIENSEFSDCTTEGNGGGIYNVFGSITVSNCDFLRCEATSIGGGIYNSNQDNTIATITDCSFTSCKANYGGGIYNGTKATLTISGVTYSNCTANTSGDNLANYGTLNP